jgi:hypothetical protein
MDDVEEEVLQESSTLLALCRKNDSVGYAAFKEDENKVFIGQMIS